MLKPVPAQTDARKSCPRCFWELIGIRVVGMKELLVGAVSFQRQTDGSAARRALSNYLSSPPKDLGLRHAEYPPHLLKVAVRSSTRSLRDFLHGLNQGEEPQIILLDLDMIELCFDFRRGNPSLERDRFAGQNKERMCFRTKDGHVLTANLHSPLQRLNRQENFFGITDVVEHSVLGELPMPDLIAHRKFFSIAAECSDGRNPTQVFDPATDALRPVIGLAAWRFFMARRKEDGDAHFPEVAMRMADAG